MMAVGSFKKVAGTALAARGEIPCELPIRMTRVLVAGRS